MFRPGPGICRRLFRPAGPPITLTRPPSRQGSVRTNCTECTMAEKLSELSWVAFTKSELTAEQRKLLDTSAMVKALAALDKLGEDKPQRLQALDDVIEQIKKQVLAVARIKKSLGDKPFGEIKDKLYGLLEVAE